jgi:hypothetical protein
MVRNIGSPGGNLWESVPVPRTIGISEIGAAASTFSLIKFAAYADFEGRGPVHAAKACAHI